MTRTRWFAIAATALAVVLGGGAALASAGSSDPASDFLGDVAKRLGIGQDRLENAIKEATIARIDAAVAAGDMTKEQGDALKERVRSGDVPAILPSFRGPGHGLDPLGHHGGFGPGGLAGTELLDVAADYLGMNDADVSEAMRDGKSLADLAEDRGKSVDGLKQTLRDAIRDDADQAVTDDALTQQQADSLVEKLSGAMDELVEETGSPGLEFGFARPRFDIGPLARPEKGFLPGAFPGADLIETAADYLDMDEADVRATMHDGDSLAELAQDRGKSVDGLEQALRDAIRKDADQAVEDDVLTKEQADILVDKFAGAVDKLVNGRFRDGFDFGFRGGHGKFELRFRIGPDGPMPLPEGQKEPAVETAIMPSQPI
jgi:lambda repressor-like predicted transcriptional regulator